MKFLAIFSLFSIASAFPSYEEASRCFCKRNWLKVYADNVSPELQKDIYDNWLAHIDEWVLFEDIDPYYSPSELQDFEIQWAYEKVVEQAMTMANPYGLVPSDWASENEECVGGKIFEELHRKFKDEVRAMTLQQLEDLHHVKEVNQREMEEHEEWTRKEMEKEIKKHNSLQFLRDFGQERLLFSELDVEE
ncbi:hypothetical protein CJU89_4355 [Yarrowia sp. B02]|nr:hypothetical protein CJU89_4355 [Yarrowia sp. B02]